MCTTIIWNSTVTNTTIVQVISYKFKFCSVLKIFLTNWTMKLYLDHTYYSECVLPKGIIILMVKLFTINDKKKLSWYIITCVNQYVYNQFPSLYLTGVLNLIHVSLCIHKVLFDPSYLTNFKLVYHIKMRCLYSFSCL